MILTIIKIIPYVVVIVLTLSLRYLVNTVRGHQTGSNTLEWKITSGGKKKHTNTHKIYTRVLGTCFFPITFIIFSLLFSPSYSCLRSGVT